MPLMPDFEKTYSKPDRATVDEILKIKTFLFENVSELHKMTIRTGGDIKDDLQNHIQLVEKLQTMKRAAFEVFDV